MQDYSVSIKGDRFLVLGVNIRESVVVAKIHRKLIKSKQLGFIVYN